MGYEKEYFQGLCSEGGDVKLVDEWRQAWKWLTVQLGALVAVAPELYEQVHAMGEYLSPSTFHHIMATLGVLVILNTMKKKSAP